MPTTIPAPPPEASGGFIVCKYTNGTDIHRARVHVQSMAVTGSAPPAPSGSNNDYLYAAPPAGGDSGIIATATRFMTAFMRFYANTWTMSLESVWWTNPGTSLNTPQEIFPLPTVTQVTGGFTGTAATGRDRALQVSWTGRSNTGGRFRCNMMNPTEMGLGVPGSAAAATTNDWTHFCYDVTHAQSAIVCHDNGKPMAPFAIIYSLNKKLRRKYLET